MTGQHYVARPAQSMSVTNSVSQTDIFSRPTIRKFEAPKDNSPSATEWKLACDVARQLGPGAACEDVKLEFLKQATYRAKWEKNKTYLTAR